MARRHVQQARARLILAQKKHNHRLLLAPLNTPEPYGGPRLNFELFRHSVERSIMDDKQKAQVGLTPRDLYVKSNPGLLSGVDYTNPRSWYHSPTKNNYIKSFLSNYNKYMNTKDKPITKTNVAVYVALPAIPNQHNNSHVRERKSRRQKHTKSSNNALPKISMQMNQRRTTNNVRTNASETSSVFSSDNDSTVVNKRTFITSLPPLPKENSFVTGLPAVAESSVASEYEGDIEDNQDGAPSDKQLALENITDKNGNIVKINDSKRGEKNTETMSSEQVARDFWFESIPENTDSRAEAIIMQSKLISQDFAQVNASLNLARDKPPLPNIKPIKDISAKYSDLRIVMDNHRLVDNPPINRGAYKLKQKSMLKLNLKHGVNESGNSVKSLQSNRDLHKNPARIDLSHVKSKIGPVYNANASMKVPKEFSERSSVTRETTTPRTAHADVSFNMTVKNGENNGSLSVGAQTFSPTHKYDIKAVDSTNSDDKHEADDGASKKEKRYVYKAPGDGYCDRWSKENKKTSFVTLDLAVKKQKTESTKSFEKSEISIPHEKFDNSDFIPLSDIPSKKSVRFEDGSRLETILSEKDAKKLTGKPKSLLKKYHTLEPFGESTQGSVSELPHEDTFVLDDPHKVIKPIERKPIYKLDTKTPVGKTAKSPNDSESTDVDLQAILNDTELPAEVAELMAVTENTGELYNESNNHHGIPTIQIEQSESVNVYDVKSSTPIESIERDNQVGIDITADVSADATAGTNCDATADSDQVHDNREGENPGAEIVPERPDIETETDPDTANEQTINQEGQEQSAQNDSSTE